MSKNEKSVSIQNSIFQMRRALIINGQRLLLAGSSPFSPAGIQDAQ
jgi:hypothetical protein